jgi:hypothetical protein
MKGCVEKNRKRRRKEKKCERREMGSAENKAAEKKG